MAPMRRFLMLLSAAIGGGAVFAAQPQVDSVEAHIAAARKAAGTEYRGLADRLCIPPPSAPPTKSATAPRVPGPPPRSTWYAKPAKVFDNLYFVGQTEYSAWAVVTNDGIIVIDPIFDYSVEEEVVNGLRALGFDPTAIKYVLISHAHSDHVGGASYLQDRFNAKVIMSEADWALLDSTTTSWRKPRRELVATDGQRLTLGDTTLTLHLTPGHTLGTISTLIPVRDGSARHVVAYWGGTAFNWLTNRRGYITPERPDSFWFQRYIESAVRFRQLAGAAGADVMLSNHTAFDGSKTKLPALATRRAGEPHPYVVGPASVARYLTVAEECAKAASLRAR